MPQKLYLITGFLGVGKTTFLKNLIALLADHRLKVIVNEFGREGVDGALLSGLAAEVEEINNGSIFCTCRLDRFEEVLAESAGQDPEYILVEASGLSDPTAIRRILSVRNEFASIEYMGGICIADAVNLKKIISTARVSKKQLAEARLVLINKTDMASESEICETESLVRSVRPDAVIRRTSFGRIQPEWLAELHGEQKVSEGPAYHLKDVGLMKLTITVRDTMTYFQLEKFLAMFIEDTYRVKGFTCLEGKTALVDCVGADLKISPYAGKTEHCNHIVALAGPGMPMEKSIRQAAKWYPDLIERIE